MIHAWRIVRRSHAREAFTGDGARIFGGRFNRKGIPAVYASNHLSLAVLEILTQVSRYDDLAGYVAFEVVFDEALMRVVELPDLPADWRALPPPESTKILGTRWAESRESVVLRIPSVILPQESNYIFNPRHEAFTAIDIRPERELEIDQRLLKQSRPPIL